MKRKTATLALAVVILILISFNNLIKKDNAADAGYSIEQVNHTIQITYNGYMLINDTFRINGSILNGFLLGFPYKYSVYLLQCIAYNETTDFPVSLNANLENRVGFYGVKVDFPQGNPQVFTVRFTLSNKLLMQNPYNTSQYSLDFPAYPSLTKSAVNCNVSILVPEGTEYIGGTVSDFRYWQQDLAAFTYSPANVMFSVVDDRIQIIDVMELKRDIRISGIGNLEGLDTYRIINKNFKTISSFEVILPQNASDETAYDQLGRVVKLTATESEEYIEQEGKDFILIFPLSEYSDCYINQTSVNLVLPEGAKILDFETPSICSLCRVTRKVFQEILTVDKRSGFFSDSFKVRVTYGYNILWLSFRPTLWMWALTIVGCAITFLWKKSKAPAPIVAARAGVAERVSSKEMKSFIDAYKQKRKIILEIKSLKERAHKGKIARRRYRVRRRTLETRLNTLSRSLADLSVKMRGAGPLYSNLMRRLEVAETEINEVEANIESIDARHHRGELSLGAYRKLRGDYERRRDEAEMSIDEVLMRLREELH